MAGLLLAIIYLAFISLGLPDSLLGSAWPVMGKELEVPLSYAGILSMLIAGGTIISSLLSSAVIRKWGTGKVTAISVLLTAIALWGFSFSKSYWMLCIWTIPYGIGAGSVDVALNNYMAVHYSSRHMSWLHAFWGLGVTISPFVMGFCLEKQLGWNMGYRSIGMLQVVLVVVLFASLPLWKRASDTSATDNASEKITMKSVLHVKGVLYVMLVFFGYCVVEATAGLWASSYLVQYRNVEATTAARFASLFYIGIMVGRFVCGFVADKLGDKRMIKIGLAIMLVGISMIALPLTTNMLALAGLIMVGLGAAPIYPSAIHSTPDNFGERNSEALVGLQMASSYVGMTLAPPVFGLVAQHISIGLYPAWLGIFTALVVVMNICLNRTCQKEEKGE